MLAEVKFGGHGAGGEAAQQSLPPAGEEGRGATAESEDLSATVLGVVQLSLGEVEQLQRGAVLLLSEEPAAICCTASPH